MIIGELFDESCFGRAEKGEVVLCVADNGIGMGENVVNMVVFWMQSDEVYLFALFLLGFDEAVDEVPIALVSYNENETYAFYAFPVFDTFVSSTSKKLAQ